MAGAEILTLALTLQFPSAFRPRHQQPLPWSLLRPRSLPVLDLVQPGATLQPRLAPAWRGPPRGGTTGSAALPMKYLASTSLPMVSLYHCSLSRGCREVTAPSSTALPLLPTPHLEHLRCLPPIECSDVVEPLTVLYKVWYSKGPRTPRTLGGWGAALASTSWIRGWQGRWVRE